jgi:hypothetical protein
LMNMILKPYTRKFVLVFFDDIFIYNSSRDEYLQHVELVFEQMRANHLFIKHSKCVFGGTSVKYLGHVISTNGVAMDPDKVSDVVAWPSP